MRIQVEKLLQYTTDGLWEILTGEFTLVMSDGELQTDYKETNYTSYIWDLVREFPHLTLKKRHHLREVLGNNRISAATNTRLLANVVWDIHALYTTQPELMAQVPCGYMEPIDFRAYLAKRSFEIISMMYNELTYRLEEYVMTLHIEDFIEAIEYPDIKNVISVPDYTESHVQDVYNTVERVLIHEPNAYKGEGPVPAALHNPLSRLVRSGLVDSNQLNQCIGVRGYITDIDSQQFPIPIIRNLTNGIRSFYDSLIESRSATKSLAFSTEPLQQTEYFNRRLQLTTQNVQYLDQGDCGTQGYLTWRMKASDLKNLVGKYYIQDDGSLKAIKRDDTHLVDQTLKLRSTLFCASKNPYGVCETCMGELALAVFRDTNLGQVCSTSMNAIISQKVLSVKHLDGSAVIETIELDSVGAEYLSVNRQGDGYLLSPRLKGMDTIKLIIRRPDAPGFTDIQDVKSVGELSTSRVSHMDAIMIDVSKGKWNDRVELGVGMVRRPASLTMDALQYIRTKGWTVDDNSNYVIDITDWDFKETLMTIPHRHFNMSDHSKQISDLLESVADQVKTRDTEVSREGFITELYELVNSRLSINLAVLEVVAYSSMIVSADKFDYSLPKPWTRAGFGVQSRMIHLRSESAEMAYQEHRTAITDPLSFNVTNRPDHPMDVFLDPQIVLEQLGEL